MAATVLVVDNDDAICRSLTEVLMEKGHQVYIASTGDKALGIVPQCKPHLIFLSAHMPGMDSLEFLHRYWQLAETHAPIIMMSTKDDTLSRALALHTHGFLEKPIQRDKLQLLIKRYIR